MISKARYWMGIGKPKNQHSLDNLKYLFGVLNKNQTVSENNKDLLIETLRSISEILIWGDQNDSSVFDFFLEKQMITFFLHYMKQKYGRYICVQLLQTLNILFENIRNETSLYFLLSNNHINNIILHKFDFADEEVMAYYISFLKTLSLKLNSHSIHFFFNERSSDFPLYVEAIKFFDHPESMVRIAVRTLTLNVFRMPLQSMQKFVKEKTAAHYFSNLVWTLRNHVLDLDISVKNTIDHTKKFRLIDLIDEYVDHLNYLQDIFMLNNQALSECLSEQLIRRLFIPVFLSSLYRKEKFATKEKKPPIQPTVALFALSHVFMIITYQPLLKELCELLFALNEENKLDQLCSDKEYIYEPKSLVQCLSALSAQTHPSTSPDSRSSKTRSKSVPHFPSLNVKSEKVSILGDKDEENKIVESSEIAGQDEMSQTRSRRNSRRTVPNLEAENKSTFEESLFNNINPLENKTDDEKCNRNATKPMQNGLIFDSILADLNPSSSEYDELSGLLAIMFFYAIMNNSGVPSNFVDCLRIRINPLTNEKISHTYHELIMEKIVELISKSIEQENKIRLATLDLATKLVKTMTNFNNKPYIDDFYLAKLIQVKEDCSCVLRRQFKAEEMFLDMFEHEYQDMNSHPLHFEMLMRDWSILLTPTSTPLSGIEFDRRFPCGDTEKLKQAIRAFFLLRSLCLYLTFEVECQLPLTKQEHLVRENDTLDLNTSDLIACTVNLKEKKDRRFMVIDPIQFILVEPEVKRIGWGIVKFSDLIQDVEVTPDKEDSRSLIITIKKAPTNLHGKPQMILNSTFTFDDHIRCMAAKQHLIRARERARRMKMEKITQLLEMASNKIANCQPNTTTQTSISSSNQSSSLNMSKTVNNSTSDINSTFNLIAGFNNLHGPLSHPGKASMISQSWFQIAQPDKRKSPTKSNESFGATNSLSSSALYKSLNSTMHASPSANNEVIAMRDLNKSDSSPTNGHMNLTSNSETTSSNSKFYLNESVSNDAKLVNEKSDQFLSSSQFNDVV